MPSCMSIFLHIVTPSNCSCVMLAIPVGLPPTITETDLSERPPYKKSGREFYPHSHVQGNKSAHYSPGVRLQENLQRKFRCKSELLKAELILVCADSFEMC